VSGDTILITGADGYVGRRLARRIMQSSDQPMILWVRADNNVEFQAKKEHLSRQLVGSDRRLSFAAGNLGNDVPLSGIDPRSIHSIVHTAAVTRFNVDEQTAQTVNVEGTQKVLKFAASCPRLQCFTLVSTIYSSGLKSGLIKEDPLDDRDGFANYYERSKWLSEAALLTRYNELPWKILRVATVIADNDNGHVVQHNAFHNTLKLFYYGLLSVVPGKASTPLYFVTGDFVANAILDVVNHPLEKVIYHVTYGRDQSPTLADLIDVAYGTFGQDDTFRRRRVLRPLYSDLGSFGLLADGMATFGKGIMNQAVSSISPFAPQLFVNKIVDNSNLRSAMVDYVVPPAGDLLRRTCAYLIHTRWGKEAEIAFG
jgi:thioester reductase-like protein